MLKTPQDVQRGLAERFKLRRLTRNLTQQGLARRAGVSFGSLKRFEQKGLISLDALLRLAMVLDCLDDFEKVGLQEALETRSLDEILDTPKQRRKGRIQ